MRRNTRSMAKSPRRKTSLRYSSCSGDTISVDSPSRLKILGDQRAFARLQPFEMAGGIPEWRYSAACFCRRIPYKFSESPAADTSSLAAFRGIALAEFLHGRGSRTDPPARHHRQPRSARPDELRKPQSAVCSWVLSSDVTEERSSPDRQTRASSRPGATPCAT